MSTLHYQDQTTLQTLVSEEFGPWSTVLTITQDMIDTFAELSGDHMWLHVDTERCAKESPFGKTIAHGFLLLSLLPRFNSAPEALARVSGFSHMMNYGSDKLRFPGAVPVDSKVHSRSRISAVTVTEHKTKITLETHLHIVGEERPALVYALDFVYL